MISVPLQLNFFLTYSLLGNIISECEKTEETLMTSWYPAVTAVFNDKNINKGLKVFLGNVLFEIFDFFG